MSDNYIERGGDVQIRALGGVNEKTGEPNPLVAEGYLLRTEERPNRFNPSKPQKFYILQSEEGLIGVFGKGGLDKLMSQAVVGQMTKIVDTETTRDIGKGNPMKVFKVFQDPKNTLDSDTLAAANTLPTSEESDSSDVEAYTTPAPKYTPKPTPAPKAVAVPTSTAAQAKIQALLNSRKGGNAVA